MTLDCDHELRQVAVVDDPPARVLQGHLGLRVRGGDYRIIYTAADDVLLVVVMTLGPSRDVCDR